jgi:Ca2+-binding EF-hand superfamily protein
MDSNAKVLNKFQTEVYRRRMRVKDVFAGFDKLNTGRCTASQFERGVNTLAPSTPHEDGKALAAYFTETGRPHPQVVNYKQFSHAMEEMFGADTSGKELPPSARSEQRLATQGSMPMSARTWRGTCISPWRGDPLPAARSAAENCGSAGSFPPPSDADQVVEKVRRVVKLRQLRVHGAFQEFDPLRRGVCSLTHLRTVLTVLNVVLTSAELEALLQKYSVHTWDRRDLDYRSFCNDVNELSIYPEPEHPEHRPRVSRPKDASGGSADMSARSSSRGLSLQDTTKVLAKMCKHLRNNRQDIGDVFRDAFRQFDPRHQGIITQQQFCRVMSMGGFDLSEIELKHLCLAFSEQHSSGMRFRCQDFLDALSTFQAIHFSNPDEDFTRQNSSKSSKVMSRQTSAESEASVQTPFYDSVQNVVDTGSLISGPPTRTGTGKANTAAKRRLERLSKSSTHAR